MSGIELAIEPGRTVTWENFVKESSQRDVGSIALDGYVIGAPAYITVLSPSGLILGVKNFNHHEDVERLATLATCGQVDLALKSGLADAFRDDKGHFTAKVFVNDSDQDVCAAVWLLRNKAQVCHTGNPLLNRFVAVAGLMDMTAGSYPFDGDLPFLEELNWINEPYNRARISGDATSSDPEVHRHIIDSVGLRISQHLAGQGDRIPLDLRYDVLAKGRRWTMIREVGAQAKMGAIQDGARALIQVRDKDQDHIHMSFWKQSEYVPMDFKGLIRDLGGEELNTRKALGLIPKSRRKLEANWGGGTTTFGSPRIIGTVLDKELVGELADYHTAA